MLVLKQQVVRLQGKPKPVTPRAQLLLTDQTKLFSSKHPGLDPATGKETTSTNYRGKVGGAKVNVTAPGTADKFDINKATKTQAGSGGFTATTNKGGPATAKFQMGPNSVNMSSANPNQATVTRKVPGQPPQQATVPPSQLTG